MAHPNDHRYEKTGTGFLVGFPPGDSRFGLVTNRHLVDIPWAKPECEGTKLESVKVEMWQSDNLRLEQIISDPKPLVHPDDSIDVGVVPFGPAFDKETKAYPYDKIENIIADPNAVTLDFKHAMSWDYLLKCEKLWPELKPGEMVAFPSYPVWYDKLETRPVFRSGMIASDPQRNYRRCEGETTNLDGNQQVLFDAFSTSGNSGSPVFVAQRGIAPFDLKMKRSPDDMQPQATAKLEFSHYHQAFLIGINAGHINDTDSERPNDHAGLSRIHKLSAIMDILRADTLPTTATSKVTVLMSKAMVDARGGIPEHWITQSPDQQGK